MQKLLLPIYPSCTCQRLIHLILLCPDRSIYMPFSALQVSKRVHILNFYIYFFEFLKRLNSLRIQVFLINFFPTTTPLPTEANNIYQRECLRLLTERSYLEDSRIQLRRPENTLVVEIDDNPYWNFGAVIIYDDNVADYTPDNHLRWLYIAGSIR